MIKITVDNNKGFEWTHNDNIFFKGYFYDTNNKLFQGIEVIEYFRSIKTKQEFIKKVKAINGSFLIILKINDIALVAVDRIRSIPIFIYQSGTNIHISDDIRIFRSQYNDIDSDALAIEQIRLSGYTLGNRTGLKNVKQLCSGEYCIVNGNEINIRKYYVHWHGNYLKLNSEQIKERLNIISDNVFSRLINSADGRQIVVPLSGGYDSRYIVCWLKKLGYENVCCFTYGNRNNIEARVSKRVAETLGYKWYCVDYSMYTWRNVFGDEWNGFFKYAGQLSQLPHEQDLYAVKYLVDAGIIEKNAIVVPGYCGDVLGGSFLYPPNKVVDYTIKDLLNKIKKRHFCYSYNWEDGIVQSILDSFCLNKINCLDEYNNIHEEWLAENRWSKYIVNAVRGYEYQGLTWRLPFWDNELVEFWYRIPNEIRQSGIYDSFLLDGIFKKYQIDIKKPNKGHALRYCITKTIKKLLEFTIGANTLKFILGKFYEKKNKDPFHYLYLQEILERDVLIREYTFNENTINSLIALYYLLRVENIPIEY